MPTFSNYRIIVDGKAAIAGWVKSFARRNLADIDAHAIDVGF